MKKIIINLFVLAIVFLSIIKCTDDDTLPTPTCDTITEVCHSNYDSLNMYFVNWEIQNDDTNNIETTFEVTLSDINGIVYQGNTIYQYVWVDNYIPSGQINIQIKTLPCGEITTISASAINLGYSPVCFQP